MTLDKSVSDSLVAAARAAADRAYCPYSGHPVGAAVLTADGATWPGCNVENASYGLAMCAERVAIASAIAAGQREIRAVAIYVPGQAPATPCGACRQVLLELAPQARLVLAWRDGVEESVVQDWLPRPFQLP